MNGSRRFKYIYIRLYDMCEIVKGRYKIDWSTLPEDAEIVSIREEPRKFGFDVFITSETFDVLETGQSAPEIKGVKVVMTKEENE